MRIVTGEKVLIYKQRKAKRGGRTTDLQFDGQIDVSMHVLFALDVNNIEQP